MLFLVVAKMLAYTHILVSLDISIGETKYVSKQSLIAVGISSLRLESPLLETPSLVGEISKLEKIKRSSEHPRNSISDWR